MYGVEDKSCLQDSRETDMQMNSIDIFQCSIILLQLSTAEE